MKVVGVATLDDALRGARRRRAVTPSRPPPRSPNSIASHAMSTDPLGNLFSTALRDAVEDTDIDEPDATPRAAATPEPEPAGGGPAERRGGECGEARSRGRSRSSESRRSRWRPLDELDRARSPSRSGPCSGVAESVSLDDVGPAPSSRRHAGAAMAALAPAGQAPTPGRAERPARRAPAAEEQDRPVDRVPEAEQQLAAWTEFLGPTLDEVYAAGRTLGGGRTRPAPERLVERLAELLVRPLRERALASLEVVVRDGPYDGAAEWQRAISGRESGARYREWRGPGPRAAARRLSWWSPSHVASTTRRPTACACAGFRPRSSSARTPTTTRSSPR